ncbi:hypothetical protein [Stagnihabitans tardus]|uniref:Sulphotransferase Stf0 domain-containing protein n=1 Tax=Stagnihabitans tardus TaxID=2699202 RepID=A0AAE5BTT7_9RHOB|nr:hypothetical protein [Stagnihabitans tardus]NBZ89420.1 hypothetical protein [Stagnihabitans tardus]
MDYPYIIWTFRRTGGTTLATILSHASSHGQAPHEPFNPDRIYGNISKEWNETGDVKKLYSSISEVVERREVIKHCFEIVPMQLNTVLLQETIRLGYRHIILKRRMEVDRLYSLEVASRTGAWGPETAKKKYQALENLGTPSIRLNLRASLTHMAECYLRARWITTEMKRRRAEHAHVDFEDLYPEPEYEPEKICDLLKFVGHSEQKIADLLPFIKQKVSTGNQETHSVDKFIENAAEWRRTVRANWRLISGQGPISN